MLIGSMIIGIGWRDCDIREILVIFCFYWFFFSFSLFIFALWFLNFACFCFLYSDQSLTGLTYSSLLWNCPLIAQLSLLFSFVYFQFQFNDNKWSPLPSMINSIFKFRVVERVNFCVDILSICPFLVIISN